MLERVNVQALIPKVIQRWDRMPRAGKRQNECESIESFFFARASCAVSRSLFRVSRIQTRFINHVNKPVSTCPLSESGQVTKILEFESVCSEQMCTSNEAERCTVKSSSCEVFSFVLRLRRAREISSYRVALYIFHCKFF